MLSFLLLSFSLFYFSWERDTLRRADDRVFDNYIWRIKGSWWMNYVAEIYIWSPIYHFVRLLLLLMYICIHLFYRRIRQLLVPPVPSCQAAVWPSGLLRPSFRVQRTVLGQNYFSWFISVVPKMWLLIQYWCARQVVIFWLIMKCSLINYFIFIMATPSSRINAHLKSRYTVYFYSAEGKSRYNYIYIILTKAIRGHKCPHLQVHVFGLLSHVFEHITTQFGLESIRCVPHGIRTNYDQALPQYTRLGSTGVPQYICPLGPIHI